MERVSEPIRMSLLDVVQKNLQFAGRTAYITRIVYTGKYNGTHEHLGEKMQTIIDDLRSDFPNVITGFLLVYPDYYLHVLEAPEDVIIKHFILMLRNKQDEYTFGKAISLPSYHHVNQKFFIDWNQVYVAVPPVLIENTEHYTLSDLMGQITNCLVKVYTLCSHIANTVCDSSVGMTDVLMHLGEKATQCLPETNVLEFFLNVKGPVPRSIDDYLRLYLDTPFFTFYNETIWPSPGDSMPYNVFRRQSRRKSGRRTHDDKRESRYSSRQRYST